MANREENARLLFNSRKYSEAADEYARLAQEEPKCAKWLTNRAKCLFHLNKHAAAIRLCRKSIEIDKAWSRAYENAGQCLLALHRYQDAQDLLEEGMQAAPNAAIEKLLTDARMALRRQAGSTEYDRRAPDFTPPRPASGVGQGPPGVPFNAAARDAYVQEKLRSLSGDDRLIVLKAERQRKEVECAADLEIAGQLPEAIKIYEREANAGCTTSMANLARIFLQGEGVASDPPKGLSWARKAVAHGPAPDWGLVGLPDPGLAAANELLGSVYRHGLAGLSKDTKLAEKHLRAAADAGDPLAMNNLASLLTQMGGHEEECVGLYRRAAAAGYARSMLNLGLHLKEGAGCARDPVEASLWLNKAAESGDLLAVRGLMSLARQLPSEEAVGTLEGARRHVQAWRAQKERDPGGKGPDKGQGGGGGPQASTLAMEAALCLEIQRARDAGLSQSDLLWELQQAEDTPPSFMEFSEDKPPSVTLAAQYREMLLERLTRNRRPTALEQEAGQLAESAGKVGVAAMTSSSGAGFPNPEAITQVLVAIGAKYQVKGLVADAHTRFYLPAAKLGDPHACLLAGGFLARSAKSGKDLRAAQRYLAQAVAQEVPGSQEELDALTARLARGDLFGGGQGGDGSSSEPEGASGLSEEDVRLAKELVDAMNLLKTALPTAETDNPFIPGGISVHIPLLEAYVSSHRDSYTGWSLLYSRRHFQQALVAMVRGDYAASVTELSLAFLFDEKGVEMPHSVDPRTGQAAPAAPFKPLFEHVERELKKGLPTQASSPFSKTSGTSTATAGNASNCTVGGSANGGTQGYGLSPYFQATVVKMCTASALPERVKYADLALKAAPHRLVPAVRRWRSLFAAFQADYPRSQADMEGAHKLLRTDASTSLWPYDPPELSTKSDPSSATGSSAVPDSSGDKSGQAPMARMREIMASVIEYDLGRVAVVLGRPADAVTHLKRFQRGVPEDTNRVCESYADLAEALMAQGPSTGGVEAELESLQRLMRESDRLQKLRVPVFRPLKPEDFPKMQQMKTMVTMLAHVKKEYPNGMPDSAMSGGTSAGGSRSAGQQRKGGKGQGNGVAGGGGASSAAWSAAAGPARTCWACGSKSESLHRCGGCRLAEYCSRECQKVHWKGGHRDVCAQMAK
eukprot:jgi/Mesvir1/29059/Mv18367-RA.1